MRSARWLPRERQEEERPYREERPYLEAPSPFDQPYYPPKVETSDSESEEDPRVIVIEI